MNGPVIEGSTFRMRPLRIEDAPAMIAWFQDPVVVATLMRRNPPSLEEEEAWIRRTSEAADVLVWVIEREGVAIGTSGIQGISWRDRNASTGTVIGDRRHWGQGVGGESMKLRTRYAFTELPLHKLNSSYLDGNVASRRAQLAAGYRDVGRRRQQVWRDGRWVDMILTEVLREEWLAQEAGGPKR